MTAFFVRRARPGDERTLRALRLEALTDAPSAFGSTYERELARTTADWQRWLSPGVTFILETGSGAKGLVAGAKDETNPGIVDLMAMWVDPNGRGSGGADALVAAVVSWAAAEGATAVRLRVIKENLRAIRCYERNGFRQMGPPEPRDGSGRMEIEMTKSSQAQRLPE